MRPRPPGRAPRGEHGEEAQGGAELPFELVIDQQQQADQPRAQGGQDDAERGTPGLVYEVTPGEMEERHSAVLAVNVRSME